MTGARKRTLAIIALGLVGVSIACVLVGKRGRADTHSLSLKFDKYGTTTDPNSLKVEEVAFLWFTNASEKMYALPLVGSKNTEQRDTLFPFGKDSGSVLVRWEFGGKARRKQPEGSLGLCRIVGPHSALRIRVPLPPEGQKVKVAVLCAEHPPSGPRLFFTRGIGLRILRIVPRSVGSQLLFSKPTVVRVWSDGELPERPEEPQAKTLAGDGR